MGERVYEFYTINTVELTAIKPHVVEIEVYMKAKRMAKWGYEPG